MEFVQLKETEYIEFWENHPNKAFLSSNKIGKLREKSGWKVYFVGIKEKEKILAAAMLLSHKRYFGKYEFYSPRGFLIDFKDKELLAFFTTKVKEFVRKNKGYILRIDPYVIYKERDIDGNIVEGGVDNSDVVAFLNSLGYRKVPIDIEEQASWMFSLNLEGKTEEDILKEMKQNTRNTIHKAEKYNINIKELTLEELDQFQNIMEETAARKHFSTKSKSYFENMYKLFSDTKEIKYYITELNLKDYIETLKNEKNEKYEKINILSDSRYNDGTKKNLREDISFLEKRIKDAEEIRNKVGKDIITLSGSMFILIQPEIIYLSGGNYEEYMKFNSQYLIQWEMIKYGIAHGFKKHNFYGIPANINTHPKDYGIYEFKRGFNGYVEELIGEFSLPITCYYYIIDLLNKIKKVIKKIIKK